MVLQRDRPIHIWGSASPGEHVSVSFHGREGNSVADGLGRWGLYLDPVPAGGPFTLTVRGKNTITYTDVLVGDLWIASGQSNMEFPMGKTAWTNGVQGSQQEIAKANLPRLRLFHVKDVASDYPLDDVTAQPWTACTPQSIANFSAVAYYFGRELLAKEGVPIGLIEADWGGTPAEAWTSLSALSSDPSLMPVFAAEAQMMVDESTVLLQQKKEQQETKKAKAEGKALPKFHWHPDPNSWAPARLFNAMIAPLTPLPIRGVIWYQGESSTDPLRAPVYARLFQTMIGDWRKQWKQGDLPFLFVQIANFRPGTDWPPVREAQRKALVLRNTGMAVTIDIGDPDNVHPTDKKDVGHRLALWARALSYGEKVEDSGPLFRQAAPVGTQMRVWFDHTQSGLVSQCGELRWFEVAGSDGKFVPAKATIEGQTVLASGADVPAPVSVRYGWAADPACNLYNGDGLPASPFTSEQ
jgi:sialate O-acetylesterase